LNWRAGKNKLTMIYLPFSYLKTVFVFSAFLISISPILKLNGQVSGGAWQNQYQKKTVVDWKILSTQQFEIVFPATHKLLAENTLRLAQKALFELSAELEYAPPQKIKFILYKDAYHFINATANLQIENWNIHWNTPKIGSEGVTKNNFNRNIIRLFFYKDYVEYYKNVKSQLAHTLLNEMLYQNENRNNLQNRTLIFPATWFFNGLSSYLGEGWGLTEQHQYQNLSQEDLINWINADEYPFSNFLLEKSVWHFIAQTYGKRKITEIIYMCRLTKSIENGFQAVLGYKISALTNKWMEYALLQINNKPNNNLPQEKITLPAPNIQFQKIAVSPNNKYLAYYKYRNNRIELNIYEPSSKITTVISKINIPTTHPGWAYTASALAFSPDNQTLAYTAYINNKYYLIYYELKTRKRSFIDISEQFSQINSIKYAPDQKNMVISAIKNGQVDLFLHPTKTNTFIQLTSDVYDDLTPCFTPDGKFIYFSSNRIYDPAPAPAKLSPSLQNQVDFVSKKYNIYKIKTESSKNSLKIVTKYSNFNKWNPCFIEGKLHFLTDFENNFYYARQKNDSVYIFFTDLPFSFTSVYETSNKLFFETDKHQNKIFIPYSLSALSGELSIKREIFLNLIHENDIEKIQHAQETPPNANDSSGDTLKPAAQDTAPKLRFYVFDDEEYLQDKYKKRNAKKKAKIKQENEIKTAYNYNLLKIERSGSYENRFILKNTGLEVEIDPIFDLNIHFKITAEDALQSLRWCAGFRPFYKPFLEMRGWDAYLKFQKYNAPIQLEGAILVGRRNIEAPHLFQYTHLQLDGSVKFVLDQFHGLNINPRLLYLQRNDQNLLGILAKGAENLSQSNSLPGLSVTYQSDNTRLLGPNYTKSGAKAQIKFSSYYSFNKSKILFNELTLDFRKYIPILKNYVLALRLQSGINWGLSKQLYMLGGLENWAFYSFENAVDLPFLESVENIYFTQFITSMRGFSYNARNGNQFGLLNTELRVPIMKLFPQHLKTKALYNLTGLLFYDLGIAWKTGNPLSQKNPIDAQTIISPPFTIVVQSLKSPFIMGVGAGMRLQFFGHTVRLDFSWPIEDGVFTRLSPQAALSLGKDF
jgi:hypothetical protein